MSNIIFLYELKYYNKSKLLDLGLSRECIDQLLKENICVKINGYNQICFDFVGVICLNQYTAAVLPKYINENINYKEKIKKIVQIIKVLKTYSKNTQTNYIDGHYLSSDIKDMLVSDIAVADYIINDYLKYGIYKKEEKEINLNGNGEIYWEDTINLLNPYIVNNKPIYLNTYNINETLNDYNYISKIHKWAVCKSINTYAQLLGYDIDVDFDHLYDIGELGSNEFVISLLEKEMRNVYLDRKINLLKALHTMISRKFLSNKSNLSLYGTKSYNIVWENMCSKVFKNQYDKYKKYIPKPKWTDIKGNEVFAKKTLEPDIIRILETDIENLFFILDAKYYNIELENGTLNNNPGVADIVKQMFYEKVFKTALSEYKKYNLFLFPKEENKCLYEVFGKVSIELLCENDIFLVYLSDTIIYNMYINSEVVKKEELINLASCIKKFK